MTQATIVDIQGYKVGLRAYTRKGVCVWDAAVLIGEEWRWLLREVYHCPTFRELSEDVLWLTQQLDTAA